MTIVRGFVLENSRLLVLRGNQIVLIGCGKENVIFTHTHPFTSVASMQDDRVLAAADTAKMVNIFSITDHATLTHAFRVPKSPTSCDWLADRLFVCDRFGDILEWSLLSSDKNHIIAGAVSTLTDLVIFKRLLFVADRDEKIRAFHLDSHELKGFLLAHRQYVSALAHNECFLVSGGGDDYVCVWEIKDDFDGTYCHPFRVIPVRASVMGIVHIGGDQFVVVSDHSDEFEIIGISQGTREAIKCSGVITAVFSDLQGVWIAHGDQLDLFHGDSVEKSITLASTCSVTVDKDEHVMKGKYRKNLMNEDEDLNASEDDCNTPGVSEKNKKPRK